MNPEEFKDWLKRHNLDDLDACLTFGVSETAIRQWRKGQRAISEPVKRLCILIDEDKTLLERLQGIWKQ